MTIKNLYTFRTKAIFATSSQGLLLFLLSAYLVLGNIPRISIFAFNFPTPITELLFYLVAAIYFVKGNKKKCSSILYLSLIFLISFIVGFFKHLNVLALPNLYMAFGYTVRLCLIFISVYVVGKELVKRFTVEEVTFYYMRIYYMQMLLAIFILLVFPDSSVLWKFLASININVVGDPHQNRLLGPFFDPNLCGTLLVFPVLLFFSKINYCRFNWKNYFGFLAFLFLIALTLSRSALVGVVVGLMCFGFITLGNFSFIARKGYILRVFLNIIFMIAVLLAYMSFFPHYFSRFSNMEGDLSAIHRLTSFMGGITLFSDGWNILTGIGYGYFSLYHEYTAGLEFDASFLNYIVTLGAPLAILGGACLTNLLRNSLSYYKKNTFYVYAALLAYLFSIFIMSFFNNWLFVPLVLFVIGPIIMYGYLKKTLLRAENV